MIHTEHVKVFHPIFKVMEHEYISDEINISSLLKLDPPQSPLVDLPDKFFQPKFKIRTFMHITNDKLSSQKPVAEDIYLQNQWSLFRFLDGFEKLLSFKIP